MNAIASQYMSGHRSARDMLCFQNYVAVGANSGGDQVRSWLAAHGKQVAAFCDLSGSLEGQSRHGLDIFAPAQCAARFGADTAFVIGTVRQREAALLLTGHLGIDPARIFPFVNPMFAAHYHTDIQQGLAHHHRRIRAYLSDTESQAYFDRVTAFYRTLDARYLMPQPRRIGQYGYDRQGANAKAGATIVDCGAFIGDTFADFIAATGGDCHIHALEAFPPNFARLVATIARDGLRERVTPMALAAGRQAGVISMSGDEIIADGCARQAEGGGSQTYRVPCDTLDNIFAATAVDYLKMDIEGADLDALLGARGMLRRDRPVVAVAAYHKPEHLVEIADFLVETLGPCRLYAAHDPCWVFHIHYIAVPDERAR